MSWVVHTDVFEGPLDLLLYLVQRDGIDLKNLPVAKVCDAYLAFLERMREVNLDVASEYLVMAATLCHLKSLELLPRPPTQALEDDDAVDPRTALILQLQAHQRAREAAAALDARPMLGRDVFRRSSPADVGEAPVDPTINAFGLLELYHGLIRAAEAPEPVVALQGPSGPSLEDCAGWLLQRLGGQGRRHELSVLLSAQPTRVGRILTFLAALELARLGWLTVSQRQHLGPVEVVAMVEPSRDLSGLTGWVERTGDAEAAS